ncbi:MAG: chromate transporter [Candidatus Omnitrophica bacterium]|nr:chromate transporter [Candidatus Omnitrophota bacterium]
MAAFGWKIENAQSHDQGAATAPCTVRQLLGYFLSLGTFGFGGPIALAGYMQRDLVEKRRWISKQDYLDGLALAQLAPGPLAAQLAMYLGYVRAGIWGATLVSLAFILPSFLMVLGISWFYVRFGGLEWMQALFYGIGAAVIGIIVRAAHKLVKLTLEKDVGLWAIFLVLAVVTAATQSEIAWLFLGAGLISMLVKAPPWKWSQRLSVLSVVPMVGSQVGSMAVEPIPATAMRLLGFFGKAGAMVFGSGLAIVPFLYGGVVKEYHWLTERQFMDAVAVAMITPGPVVITVAFIGYLVRGPWGATLAAIGVFLPVYLFVILPAPWFKKHGKDVWLNAFVKGVTAAATGAIAGACVVLAQRAIVDIPTAVIALVTLGVLSTSKKVHEPVLILASGLAGLLLFKGMR